jgi:hypothetical protein
MSGAQVFVSYSRQDRARVEPLVEALTAAGLTVWYDAGLQAGDAYDSKIMAALQAAKAVLVVWSKTSVDSQWVRAEATEGRALDKLVACQLEPCRPFPPFNLVHTEDLAGFTGSPQHGGYQRLLAAVRSKVEGRTVPVAAPAPTPVASARPPWRIGALVLAGAAVVALGLWLAVGQTRGPAGVGTEIATAAPVMPRTPPADLARLQQLDLSVTLSARDQAVSAADYQRVEDNLLKIGGAGAVRWVEIEPEAYRTPVIAALRTMGVPDAALPPITDQTEAEGPLVVSIRAYGQPLPAAASGTPTPRPGPEPSVAAVVAERMLEEVYDVTDPDTRFGTSPEPQFTDALLAIGRGELLQVTITGYSDPTIEPVHGGNGRRLRSVQDLLIGVYNVPAEVISTEERRDATRPRVEVRFRYRPAR